MKQHMWSFQWPDGELEEAGDWDGHVMFEKRSDARRYLRAWYPPEIKDLRPKIVRVQVEITVLG